MLGFTPVRWMLEVNAIGNSPPAAVGGVGICTKGCACQWTNGKPKVDCSDRNLTSLPKDLSAITTHL